MLTVKLARRIRERGLALPTTGEFETPRLKEIALRMAALFADLKRLDREIEEEAKKGE